MDCLQLHPLRYRHAFKQTQQSTNMYAQKMLATRLDCKSSDRLTSSWYPSAKKKIGDWYRAEACISYMYMDPYDLCIIKI